MLALDGERAELGMLKRATGPVGARRKELAPDERVERPLPVLLRALEEAVQERDARRDLERRSAGALDVGAVAVGELVDREILPELDLGVDDGKLDLAPPERQERREEVIGVRGRVGRNDTCEAWRFHGGRWSIGACRAGSLLAAVAPRPSMLRFATSIALVSISTD